MSSAQYLYRRSSGVYFVRFCVPAAFKAAVGRSEVHRTTGCRDLRLAKIVAAQMAIHWHRSLEQLVEHEQDQHGLRNVVIDVASLARLGERRILTQALAIRFIDEVRLIITDGTPCPLRPTPPPAP